MSVDFSNLLAYHSIGVMNLCQRVLSRFGGQVPILHCSSYCDTISYFSERCFDFSFESYSFILD